jgi:GDP-4-dehydro-6-deoxy-D-mannose reductase
MKILLTGHTGFVGAALSHNLSSCNHEVIGVSRATGYELHDLKTDDHLPASNVVIHLAGVVGVEQSWKYPDQFLNINYNSTLAIAEYARKHKVPVVFLSSYMYGNPIYLPVDEKHPTSCNNPYAYSKKMSEDALYAYHKLFGIDVVVLRPMNLYGVGMASSNIIDLIAKQALSGDQIVLRDLSPKRDYLHVDDLCSGILKVVNSKSLTGFNIFNLGYGVSYSVLDIVTEIGALLNRKLSVKETGEVRVNEILDCYADISKFSSRFDWVPKLNIKDGLLKTL